MTSQSAIWNEATLSRNKFKKYRVKKEDTKLEVFSFGDEPEDIFYCLVDLNISPDGLNIEKLKLADPRNFDHMLKEMGCLAMTTGQEADELEKRGELGRGDLHNELYELCKDEGVI